MLNKYFPPDFDPAKLPKLHLAKDRQYVIRIMAPFSMCCKNCGEYIYKGKKFNSRKETVIGENYLGIPIFRFYIRCTRCVSEITFKTDPENTDYTMEHGATRNFQAVKLAEREEKRAQQEREEEEANNPMKALENRTKESKREMDILDALEDIKDQNARHAQVNMEAVLGEYRRLEQELAMQQEQEDEEEVRRLFGDGGPLITRLRDSDSDNEQPSVSGKGVKRPAEDCTEILTEQAQSSSSKPRAPAAKQARLLSGLVKVKPKAKKPNAAVETATRMMAVAVAEKPEKNEPAKRLPLVVGYGSSSSSDSDS